MSEVRGSTVESRFVYYVPGRVPDDVRAWLDHRYGAGNWFSLWEEEFERWRRRNSMERLNPELFFETCHVFKPHVPRKPADK